MFQTYMANADSPVSLSLLQMYDISSDQAFHQQYQNNGSLVFAMVKGVRDLSSDDFETLPVIGYLAKRTISGNNTYGGVQFIYPFQSGINTSSDSTTYQYETAVDEFT